MKKILNSLLVLIISTLIITNSVSAEELKKLHAWYFDPPQGIGMLEGENFLGDLPGITIVDDKGVQVQGVFTYPNYDNKRLGIWDLEWVFTPTDPSYETLTGTIKLNVRAREAEASEVIELPTTPSLTATTVSLNTLTAYDVNLDNKVSGSTYAWTSSDPDTVEVNAKSGYLKAKKEGKATITCEITLPDQSKQFLSSIVTVGYDENAPLLTETNLDLETGDVFDINLENKVAKSKYRWVSSDKSVVKVNSANGKVTAIGEGAAFVTCTITTPEKQIIVLRCDINVTAPAVVTE